MTTAAPQEKSLQITRQDTFELLCKYTSTDSLVKHALAVEASLRWYARHYGEDEEFWGITGLIHDFDYEQNPTPAPDGHPFVGCRILEQEGYPEEIITAVLGHATYSGVARESLLAKTLFACDELTGLVTAAVLVRPDRSLHTLTAKSVKKKMKDKGFARAVNREDIILGAEELGVELGEHISNVISGMQTVAQSLGLAGE